MLAAGPSPEARRFFHAPNGTKTMARITIFDTTLRDGEQSPGSSMTAPEKLRLAHELASLGVDVLEAGFAASLPFPIFICSKVPILSLVEWNTKSVT